LPTLLHIDSSPRTEASISRHLSSEFAATWTSANPGGRTIVRDLTTTDLQPISSEWIAACHMSPSSRTASQSEILGLSDTLIAELKSADDYIIGVPMHNFGVPSSLKLWIDQIVRAGETFSYVDGAPAGLLKNKRATFIIASGGLYNAGTAMASFDFVSRTCAVFSVSSVSPIPVSSPRAEPPHSCKAKSTARPSSGPISNPSRLSSKPPDPS
jgi:FMN-dependent NADH-azoreductase